MTETQKNIIQSAQRCFFQYGYSKTSMSLVSEYSGVSRVTVHKHFKNKEGLFRSVIGVCISESMQEAKQLLTEQPSDDCWYNIERYMLVKTRSIFDNVTDTLILKDLHNSAHDIAQDLMERKKAKSAEFIAEELTRAEKNALVDLSNVDLTALQLGTLIMHSFSGLFMHEDLTEIRHQLQNLIRVFNVATKT